MLQVIEFTAWSERWERHDPIWHIHTIEIHATVKGNEVNLWELPWESGHHVSLEGKCLWQRSLIVYVA